MPEIYPDPYHHPSPDNYTPRKYSKHPLEGKFSMSIEIEKRPIPLGGKTTHIHREKIPPARPSRIAPDPERIVRMRARFSPPPPTPEDRLDQDFIISDNLYAELLEQTKLLFDIVENFEIGPFLTGIMNEDCQHKITLCTERIISIVENMKEQYDTPKAQIYKMLIGFADRYDKQFPQTSTFAIRSAILKASAKDGAELESWMAYTKGGKPQRQDIWPFLDQSRNWIPEAQRSLGKFIEKAIVEARTLAKEHPSGEVILLKGGFGAGKTRQINQLFGETATGAVAPDKAKTVVRKSLPTVSHGSAHVQGSQIAYQFFDEIITRVAGTVVYDSSLSNPADLNSYIQKAIKADKKAVVVDVTRNDFARFLAVLKRSVTGEDPRIPIDFIINGTIRDKLQRFKCIQEVLLFDLKVDPRVTPEYRFLGGDEEGWNIEEVVRITPSKLTFPSDPSAREEAIKRLALEGITYDEKTSEIITHLSEKTLRNQFNKQLNNTVTEVIAGISKEEGSICTEVFGNRPLTTTTLAKHSDDPSIHIANFYDALDDKVKAAITKKEFLEAFKDLNPETLSKFSQKIDKGTPINYLDLPLRAALIINSKLKSDPWI